MDRLVKRTLEHIGYEGSFPIYFCHEDAKLYYELVTREGTEYREVKSNATLSKFDDTLRKRGNGE